MRDLSEKLDTLPSRPGVYVFRGHHGETLYVGKARSLKSRVRSYFQPSTGDSRHFIALLDHELADIETFVVATEKEAALLENQLIKEYQPKYNVKLRDDKDYLSLRLDPGREWPRLEVVRRPKPDGARYFGPYHSATSARQTLRLVNRFFNLRTCTDAEMASRRRPCLQYQIQRCPAPCVLPVDRGEYGRQVELVSLFLDGRHDELIEHLEREMNAASKALEYERAARYRDQLRAVGRVREEQRVAVVRDIDQDVVGLYRQADQAQVALLMIRGGKLVGVRTYDVADVKLPDDELLASFLREYYPPGSFVPAEVLVPRPFEAMDGLAEVLGEQRGARVEVRWPRRGSRVSLVAMANANAEHAFRERLREREGVEERLHELQRKLRLPRPPRRLECVDVSHRAGEDTVAALVSFRDGAPHRAGYRTYHVRNVAAGDDYGAMYQVLSRRFRRGRAVASAARAAERPGAEGKGGWELPDVMVVDGGRGQLNVALAALRDLGVDSVPVVALAKEKTTAGGAQLVDRVYLPGQKNPIVVRESSPALQVLAFARDEAHRASNLIRTRREKRRQFASPLDAVPGVGPKTKARLLSALGSIDAIRRADEGDLLAAGATRAQAHAIREALGLPHVPPSGPNSDVNPGPTRGVSERSMFPLDEAEAAAVDDAFQPPDLPTGRA